jgi:hypothetical protein
MIVDISPVVQAIVGLAATALGIIGSAVLMKLNTKLHLQISAGQQEAFDSALKKALIYGATKATSEIASKGWDHPSGLPSYFRSLQILSRTAAEHPAWR